MSGILHSWPIEIDFNRAQIRSRIRESDILDLKSVASYIVFTDGSKYYAKNGSTGMIEYSDVDASNVVQYAINNTSKGIVYVKGVNKPGGIVYKPRVAVVYDMPYFDVVEPPSIYKLWSITTGSGSVNARNIYVEDDILYLAGIYEPFQIYDISDIDSPKLVLSISSITPVNWSTIAPNMMNITKIGNYVIGSTYVGLLILDVSRLDSVKAKVLALGSTSDYYIHGFAIKGRYLYGAMHRINRFAVIDISDPWNPVVVNWSLQIPGAHDVVIDDNVAYVTSYTTNNLYVVDISNPYSPSIITTLNLGFPQSYVKRVGKYLFVGDHIGVGRGKMAVVKVFNPSQPQLVKVIDCPIYQPKFGYWMDVWGDYLFAISDGGYVHVLDISDPENAFVIYSVQTEWFYMMHILVYNDIVFARGHTQDLSRAGLTAFKIDQLFKHDYKSRLWYNTDILRQYTLLSRLIDDIKNRRTGVATIPAGSTRITVSHGLITTPSKVLITPLGSPPGKLWVENITSTSFDIVTDTATTSNLNVAWYAEV
ncbi:MAG: hypothetical protein LM558_00235 [Thermosphaera sp.]|nr:hypothetical protein [Thermosphaera sp.]